MKFGLVFASGPTPDTPCDARMLGYEERKLGELCAEEDDAFGMYCHRASIPELVALVRALDRDCTFEVFAERQALLRVGGRP